MLEPFAFVPTEINYEIPAAFYGTNASCNVPGADYIAAYDQWQFSKIRTGNNVSDPRLYWVKTPIAQLTRF